MMENGTDYMHYTGSTRYNKHNDAISLNMVRVTDVSRTTNFPDKTFPERRFQDNLTPFPQTDIIGAMVIVWRVRGKIIRSVLCNIVCNNCAQSDAHTYEQT